MSTGAVAIIGMDCVFPGAPDLASFRRNLADGVDAITDVPPERWEPVFYDPEATAVDRFYCRRAGFIHEFAAVDVAGFGLMPAAAAGAEPDQLLTLHVAARALADAGYEDRPFPRERTSVIVGRGNYSGAGMVRLDQHVRTAQQLVECLRVLLPDVEEEQLTAIKRDFQARLGPYGPDSAIGLVPNLTASRVANRLDLGGSTYTVDAACASALVAVDRGVAELNAGTADLALAGAIHVCHDVGFWSVFCQLGALSRREEIRPFDRRADGVLIGEGVGLVVLKRLVDAERDGDRVYAVIRGTGVASDGRHTSLMTPSVEGQLRALERAWGAARLDPASVGLVEAHGTATPVGDATELETLARFFGPANGAERVGLGSVKSMIGHAMAAAGAAGLIKAALAVHDGLLPPTLHCDDPHPLLEQSRFRPIREAEPWEAPVRRAGVNAFGFGGINAHVVLDAPESPQRSGRRRARPATSPAGMQVLALAADSQGELLDALDSRRAGPSGSWRLAVVDPTPERVAAVRAAVEKAKPRRGRDGIWFTADGLVANGGRVAFVFSGVEAAFEPRIEDVANHFGWAAPALPSETLVDQAVSVAALGRLMDRALGELGIRPDVIAGHSVGEWCGLHAAGVVSDESVDDLLARLDPGAVDVPAAVYAAVGCSAERAGALASAFAGVSVSHDNCPHQAMLCGTEEAVESALGEFRRAGVLGQKLDRPRSGVHSPLFRDYLEPFRQSFEELALHPQQTPLWSATTCAPYPHDPDEIRELSIRHLVEPVRFRELVLALYEHGVRVFVQVGTGSLIGFIEDTLAGRPQLAIAGNVPNRSGIEQLRWTAAALFVEGVPVQLDRIGIGPPQPARKPMRLSLGVPLVRLGTPPLLARRPAARGPETDDPVVRELAATLAAVEDAGEAVRLALAARPRPASHPPVATERSEIRRFSVDEYPELADHCLLRQPPGRRHLDDRHPVVPLTMSIALLVEAAQTLVPERIVIGVVDVTAQRWLEVAPPVETSVRAELVSPDRVRISIEGYVQADVLMADAYPAPPPPDRAPLDGERPAELTAEDLYRERWMFHGPAYQAVRRIDTFGTDGTRGVLEALPARGALLDGAGQLLAYWLMASTETDWLVMPVGVERIEFFEPEPAGALVDCTVRIREVGPRQVRGNIELVSEGRVCARVVGWRDHRFESDARMKELFFRPEHALLSERSREGYAVVRMDDLRIPSYDDLAKRYLTAQERAELAELAPRRRRDWLAGRIAAKDAVRRLLFERGREHVYPVEVRIAAGPQGRPLVVGDFDADLRVSIAHANGVAVALAEIGRDPGIDVEEVEDRSKRFESLVLDERERSLVPEAERQEWLTRFWCAKEAVGKANGTGLDGDPRRLAVSRVEGERLCVAGEWIETRRMEPGMVVAWTAP